MTSPIYINMHSPHQQVRTKLCMLFICFAVFLPLNLLIMHDKQQKSMLASFDINFIRLDQKHLGLARQASPYLCCFQSCLIDLIAIDTNYMVFSISRSAFDIKNYYLLLITSFISHNLPLRTSFVFFMGARKCRHF